MKKTIVIILSVLILLGGVAAGVYLVQQQQEFREKAQPATSLSLVTNNPSPTAGETFTVSVAIETGENQVVGVQMYLNYDPSTIQVNNISPGSFFSNPTIYQSVIDDQAGLVTYILYLPLGSQAGQGQGTVALLDVTAVSAGSTTLSFDSQTRVGAFQEEVNVLVGTTPLTINVLGAEGPTATQAPSPTEQPVEPTPTGTLAPSPTSTDDGTGGQDVPTSTPTSTPSPTRTPTPTEVEGGSEGQEATNTPTTSFSEDSGIDELPDSGIGEVTLVLVALGALIFLFSLSFI